MLCDEEIWHSTIMYMSTSLASSGTILLGMLMEWVVALVRKLLNRVVLLIGVQDAEKLRNI